MAHPDMDTLLDEGLKLAIKHLEKHGEFYPFGLTMPPQGKIAIRYAYTGDEHPPSQELIDLLLEAFQQGAKRGEFKATALVSDSRISLEDKTKTDAISVTIEHRDEEPVTCLLPYVNDRGTFEFGELSAQPAERQVFKI